MPDYGIVPAGEFGPGSVRADGRNIHDTYIFEVVRRVPAAESTRSLAEGHCELASELSQQ